MEIIDKEQIAKRNSLTYSGSSDSVAAKNNYKAGLEYAENHYLKIIEEKDKEIEKWKMLSTTKHVENEGLRTKLKKAKELLYRWLHGTDLEREAKTKEFLNGK